MFFFIAICSKLGTAGQRMGGAAALCHIRHDPVASGEPGNCFTLKAANVGRCQAVLCRGGKAQLLSDIHTVREESEYERVRQHDAIITEVEPNSSDDLRESICSLYLSLIHTNPLMRGWLCFNYLFSILLPACLRLQLFQVALEHQTTVGYCLGGRRHSSQHITVIS